MDGSRPLHGDTSSRRCESVTFAIAVVPDQRIETLGMRTGSLARKILRGRVFDRVRVLLNS